MSPAVDEGGRGAVGDVLIVVNRGASGTGPRAPGEALVAAVGRSLGPTRRVAMVVEADSSEGVAAACAQRLRAEAGVGTVVACGGDGTVTAVAGVLAGTDVRLAIVPGGAANLFAAALGIPSRRDAALAVLADGVTRVVDLGRATWRGRAGSAAESRAGPEAERGSEPASGTRTFGVACGTGLDARVMAATPVRRKRRLGQGAYFAATLGLARELRPVPVVVEVDGRRTESDALAVLVVNAGELIPGVVRPHPPVRPDDGLLDVFVLRGHGPVATLRSAFALLGAGGGVRGGRHGWRERGRGVSVSPRPAQPIEVDGDVVGEGDFEATIEPGAIGVLVPPRNVDRAGMR